MAFGGMVRGQGDTGKPIGRARYQGPPNLLSVGKDNDPLSVCTNILREGANQVRRQGSFFEMTRLLPTIVLTITASATGCWTDIAYDPTTEVADADQAATMTIDPLVTAEEIEANDLGAADWESPAAEVVEESLAEGFAQDSAAPQDPTPDEDELAAESFGAELAAVEATKLEPSSDTTNPFTDSPEETPLAEPESLPTADSSPGGDRYAPMPWETNGIEAPPAAEEAPVATTDDLPAAGNAAEQVEASEREQLGEAGNSLDWLTGSTDLSAANDEPSAAKIPPAEEVPVVEPTTQEPAADEPLAELEPEQSPATDADWATTEQPQTELVPLPWETPAAEETDAMRDEASTGEMGRDETASVESLPLPTDSVESEWESDTEPADLVDQSNTQLLTWLVAGKLSSALADAQQNPVDALGDVTAYANQLNIDLDALAIAPSRAGEVSPKQLLAVGRKLGEQVATQHDRQHAALAEVAFKSQLLVALLPTRPHLKDTVSGSVVAAAKRAALPDEVWKPWEQSVATSSDGAEIARAVRQLHDAIAQHLGERRPPRREGSSPVFR